MNSTLSESDEALAFQELRIVLIGRSGAGKSSIGNVILGREAFKETTTRESEKHGGRAEDRNISIIDTPGFFNPRLTDEELQEQMMKSLDLSHPGPHVFLLVIRLDRFTEDVGKIVKSVHRYFGKEAFRFMMVLFTGREAMSKREWIEFRFSKKTRELLSFCEEKCHVIIHKHKRDVKQISSLLENISEVLRKNGREHYSKEMKMKVDEDETRSKEEKNRADLHVQTENSVQKEQRETNQQQNHETSMVKEEKKETPESNSRKMTDLRIVLLGKSGSGKSSTANTILGQDTFKTKSFPSTAQTCEKQEAEVCGRNICVFETPGLMETQIQTCVEMTDIFLLVLRLDEMITDEEKNTVKWIQEKFGEEAVHHTIILFTHADHLKGKTLEELIRENNTLQALVDECEGRFHLFNNKEMENRSQVTELMEKIEKMENRGQNYTSKKLQKHESEETDEETEEKHTEMEVNESPLNWLRGALVFFIGALAAAAVAKTGFDG